MNVSTNGSKAGLGFAGGTCFLVAGILLALSARKHQLSGALMPNGKGGFMSFRDGYYLSVVLITMAAGWMYCGFRSARPAPAPQDHGDASI